MRRGISPDTSWHLQKLILILTQRLSSAEISAMIQDSTVATVVALAMFSCMINDHAGAKAHLSGLQQMVRLRGGIEGFDRNIILQLKLGRVDLVYAINTGSDGLLCTHPILYSPLFYELGTLSSYTTTYHDPSIYGASDIRILTIFREMQNYSCLISHAQQTQQRRPESEYLAAICSFQYRLLQLQGLVNDRISECLRLAMLAFLVTTFQFPGVRARYPYLADQLREWCHALNVKGCTKLQELMRWILIVGAISVFDLEAETEQWMGEKWRISVDAGWEEVRMQLRQIMWIDALQDTIGQTAFIELSTRR
ncbi:hypothetical protein BDW59DRAFT_141066 [Aspergillus cavernicola]|uniref:Fungal-specific transcription factor domain-containing protein n=1 Tax=Aspergillus cavernicola TaxID=176166 RepID=A0ABR4IRY1_9EURO